MMFTEIVGTKSPFDRSGFIQGDYVIELQWGQRPSTLRTNVLKTDH
jgi:hypothetical protein